MSIRTGLVFFLLFLGLNVSTFAEEADPQENILQIVIDNYRPEDVNGLTAVTRRVMQDSIEAHKKNPEIPKIVCVPQPVFQLPGEAWRASFMMSLAANIAPDILFSYWHETRQNIEQGYLMPLNEYIGEDEDGNGLVDVDEAIWDGWKEIDPKARFVATVDGKIYALPIPRRGQMALFFRKDLFRAAGLDPNKIPESWDELFYILQKLTDPGKEIPGARFQRGQRGFFLTELSWQWLLWLNAAGGQCLTQFRTDPATGKEYGFDEFEREFIATDPDTGKTVNLKDQPSKWRATFDSEAGQAACEFYHRLCWQKWIRMDNGEPLNLTEAEVEQGWATNPETGEKITFGHRDIITGVVRKSTAREDDALLMFRRGEVAMIQAQMPVLRDSKIPPENLGFFPIPGRFADMPPSSTFFMHMYGLNHLLAKPENKDKRDVAWEILSSYSTREGRIAETRADVELGFARFTSPRDLKEAGMTEYIKQIPKEWLKRYKTVEQSWKTEPFMGFWLLIEKKLDSQVLGLLMVREDFDYHQALRQIGHQANTGMMVERSEEEMDRYRPTARILFLLGFLFFAYMTFKMIKMLSGTAAEKANLGRSGSVYHPALPWLMLAPALLSILLWNYYPLAKGSIMAFQDYHILKESPFVGLDNFIEVFLDPEFYTSLWKTIKYVFIALGLSFFTPIFLAILLHEAPRFKTFFRTIFFLPQISSAMVVMLIWMLMYNPTEYGLLNQIITGIDDFLLSLGIDIRMNKQNWLGDPRWAMIAVVIPLVWATAGIASLIYLAALKSIDEESYEAAEIDGAGMLHKLWYVTIPYLKPLIIINFVAAFIGTFHNMDNILIMTGGGPGQETMVLSLRIWLEAYVYQRYSRAVVMAWVLGIGLIAFTVYQLKILKKVEFRRAEEN